MPKGARSKGVLALVTWLAMLTATARASDGKAEARELLRQGAQLVERGRFVEALETYKRAYSIVPSAKILYNFGLCYRATGRPAEALESFERFLAEAKDVPAVNVKLAREFAAALRAQVATLEVTGDTNEVELSVDGRSYGRGTLPPRIALSPGSHQVTAERVGQSPFLTRIEVRPGERVVVSVFFPKPAATTASRPSSNTRPPSFSETPSTEGPTVSTAHDPRQPASDWKRTAAWITAGSAAVLAAGGTWALMAADRKYGDFNAVKDAPLTVDGECSTSVKDAGGGRCQGLLDSANRHSRWATAGLVAGGAAAVGATLLFLTSTSRRATGSAMGCAPTMGMTGASCRVRF